MLFHQNDNIIVQSFFQCIINKLWRAILDLQGINKPVAFLCSYCLEQLERFPTVPRVLIIETRFSNIARSIEKNPTARCLELVIEIASWTTEAAQEKFFYPPGWGNIYRRRNSFPYRGAENINCIELQFLVRHGRPSLSFAYLCTTKLVFTFYPFHLNGKINQLRATRFHGGEFLRGSSI